MQEEALLASLAEPASAATTIPLLNLLQERKVKSLRFRLRRREQRTKEAGAPFNKRDAHKNVNRQAAALKRKRDGNGKFLNVPIYPRAKQTRCDWTAN